MTYLAQAQNWLAQDPDPETRAELEALIPAAQAGDAAALSELENRFNGRLQFGTAGLRGKQQAGSMGMNRVLVAQAAKGLADYILQFDPKTPSIVIGYDGRKNSDIYARANERLSLSPMTFSHQMVRLIFTEQLYRACTIIKGEPYHHE